MSPFLSFFLTRAVAHLFKSKLDVAEEDVIDVLMLGAGLLLEVVGREELLVLLEAVDDESLPADRSSPRFSSSRCSSSLRERLLRQSRELRSPKRRERSRSRLLPSDCELSLGACAKAVCVVGSKQPIADQPIQVNAVISTKCKRGFISVSTLPALRCFASTPFNANCCHCNRLRPPLCGQRLTHQN
jgi:hypothetical protein